MFLHPSQEIWNNQAKIVVKHFLKRSRTNLLSIYPVELVKLIILFGLPVHHFVLDKESKNHEFSKNNGIVALKTREEYEERAFGNFIWDKKSIKDRLYNFIKILIFMHKIKKKKSDSN